MCADFENIQGLQLESAERLDAKQRADKELATLQEVNKELQAVAAQAEVARQELVPAGELMAARSTLGTAEQRIAELERELQEAKEEASSAKGELRPPLRPRKKTGRCRKPSLLGFRTIIRR